MMRVPVSEPPRTIRQEPAARCRSWSARPSSRPSGEPEGREVSEGPAMFRSWIIRVPARARSESRQALRAVVGDGRAGDFLQRTVRLGGVAHQFRGIPVNLVEIGAIRREPVVARAAADGSIQRPEGAISRHFRARRILCELQPFPIDVVAADVAVAEVRSVDRSVIRRHGEPAQFRGLSGAGIDRHHRADADLAVVIDGAQDASVTNGLSENEGIQPVVQEGDIERRTAFGVVEPGCSERAVLSDGAYDAIDLSEPPGRRTQRIGEPSGFALAGSSKVVPTKRNFSLGETTTMVDT